MRKFVKDGTVDGVRSCGYPRTSATSPARPPRRSSPGASPARRATSSRPAGSASTRSARTARSSSARRRRSTRRTSTSSTSESTMTASEHRRRPAARRSRPAPARGSGSSASAWTPTGPSSTGSGSASRATSAASRSGSPRSAATSCPRGSSTPREGARGGRPLRGRAGRPRALPRRHLRDVEPRCCRSCRRRRCRSCCSACSRRASLDYANTDTGEWLANCAACCVPELAGAFTRARIPYDTVAGTIDDDERAWAKIGAWVRAAGVARALRRVADRLPRATRIRGCSTCTRTSPPCTRSSARTSRCSRSTTSARAWRAATDEEVAAKEAEIRAMFDFADPSDDPIAGPIEPEQLDWSARVAVGLDRLVADFDARRADLLLPRRRRQRGRAPRRRRDRRQLAAHRARRADGGRGRPQDEPRPAHPRPARRRRLLHRVLRARLRRGLRAHGPRRPGARRDRRGPPDAARAAALPRQARRRA